MSNIGLVEMYDVLMKIKEKDYAITTDEYREAILKYHEQLKLVSSIALNTIDVATGYVEKVHDDTEVKKKILDTFGDISDNIKSSYPVP